MTSIAGQFVTETLPYDGGRQVTAYVPPASPEAVVFAVYEVACVTQSRLFLRCYEPRI